MSSAGEAFNGDAPAVAHSAVAHSAGAAPTDDAPPPPAELPVPPEPVELRQQLQTALLAGEGWEARFGPELGVGAVLWTAWGQTLSASGMTREQFAATVRGYRRELWFWVLGDRVWPQAASGLAGRLRRRAPSGPPAT